jgi:3-methyladenine DNA glycosylase/8-oxoguanine DNA glycosylase
MNPNSTTLILPTPQDFDFPKAVCSYGYFLLAPNRWDPATQTLHRPLHGLNDRLIHTAITQSKKSTLTLRANRKLNPRNTALLQQQVTRMLRLDEDFRPWRRLHPAARRLRFGRLFRSPTLFEDIVKTITGCNVSWPNTIRMNQLLCQHFGNGGFPTAQQLAAIRTDTLKTKCKVGYRAQRIVRLARQITRGKLQLKTFEDPSLTTDQIEQQLRLIYGIGPYAAANICQLLGRYDRLAIDSETYRHFRKAHNTRKKGPELDNHIRSYYERFAPYQFIAYWFDLWNTYQRRFGRAEHWDAEIDGKKFTASNLQPNASKTRT